jgi:glycosyltransferase involved in cell wall biosynthesis
MGDTRATVRVFFPIHCTGRGLSRCVLDLGDHFESDSLGFEYWCLGASAATRRGYHRMSLSSFVSRVAYRLPDGEQKLRRHLERAYLDATLPGDIAYLWPGSSLRLCRALKERGALVVVEMVNSAAWNYQRVMDGAYRKWGLTPNHRVDDAFVAEEEAKLGLADYVFSPSPLVTETLLATGMPLDRILPTTYAFDPRSFAPAARRAQRGGARPVFLCVAHGSLRKGYPELLDLWARSGVRGTLRLVGPIDDEVRAVAGQHLARPDVEVLPYVDDLAPVYASADAFVLASHEEGSPLVAYMALAAGLPILATPAVASGIIEDGVQGLVRDLDDEEGFRSALAALGADHELRRRLGARGRERARELTWGHVAKQRCRALEAVLGKARRARGITLAERTIA